MINNDFVFLFCCIVLCIVFYIYGFYKGINWAQKEYQEILEKSKKNCEEAMKIADEWKESATRLLKEKYSVVNGGGFRNESKN